MKANTFIFAFNKNVFLKLCNGENNFNFGKKQIIDVYIPFHVEINPTIWHRILGFCSLGFPHKKTFGLRMKNQSG